MESLLTVAFDAPELDLVALARRFDRDGRSGTAIPVTYAEAVIVTR